MRLRRQGLSFAEIGPRLGVTRQCAYALLSNRPTSRRRNAPAPATCFLCGGPFVAPPGRPAPEQPPPTSSARGTLCLPCLARQPDAAFPQRLRSCRLAAGLTATRLCTLAGLPRGRVSRYEAGYSEPRYEHLRRIARVLGSPLTLVLMGVGE